MFKKSCIRILQYASRILLINLCRIGVSLGTNERQNECGRKERREGKQKKEIIKSIDEMRSESKNVNLNTTLITITDEN